jgi:PKD repeat protein
MIKRHVFRRIALLSVIFSVLVFICCGSAAAETITVCPSGCNYTSIQDAIDHASSGDTIEVMNGTYTELITVDKPLTITGENPAGTMISGNYAGNVVTISADNVVFTGFSVTKGYQQYNPNVYYFGIGATNVTNLSISSCRVTDSSIGIYANNATGLSVSDTEISDCVAQGVLLLNTNSSQILSNRIHDNEFGVMGSSSDTLVCSGNNLTHNQYDGLCFIDGVTDSLIQDNVVRDNCYLNFNDTGDFNQAGGYFEFVRDSAIRNNTFTHNGGIGMYLSEMQQSVMDGNVMEGNYAGFSYNDMNPHPDNTISLSNTVDGSPILYLEGVIDRDITGEPFSCIYLISCRNVTVHDMALSDRNGLGITARGGSGIRADRNSVSNNVFQNILFTLVVDGSIDGNFVTGAPYGIGVMESVNVTASGNMASGNNHGLGVASPCHNVHLVGNTVEDNDVGISIEYATGDGTDSGISCTGNQISGSTSEKTLGINFMDSEGISAHHNTIRGQYEGLWIDGGKQHNASFLSIENCTFGIEISSYTEGLGKFTPARNNVVAGNTVSTDRNAFFTDMEFPYVFGNHIFLNSFTSQQKLLVPSDIPALERARHTGEPVAWGLPRKANLSRTDSDVPPLSEEPNILNTETPVLYKYHGVYFNGYLGNYWNWYNGTDTAGNGVGSTPYKVIVNNTDYYPLVAPANAYTVGPAPSFFADFTASPVQGTAPLTVQFTDNSTGNPILWLYKFGDGLTSTAKNPKYTYRSPGNYTVSLTIWKMGGQTLVNTTTEKPLLITVTGSPVPALTANFTAAPLNGPAPLAVTFTDTSTDRPDYWSYTFGDGSASTMKNPTHVYRIPGTYTVNLTVMKVKDGMLLKNMTVKQDLIAVSGQPGQLLTANFTASPLNGTAPLRVTFTDASTGNPQFWNYDFGDGTSSGSKNPVHTYLVRGNYTVSLTVFKVQNSILVRNTTVVKDLVRVQ